MFNRIPNYIKYIFLNVLILFIYVLIFRVIFYNYFLISESETITEIKKAFFLGFRYDLKLTIISLFPLSILVLITNYNFFKSKLLKSIALVYMVLTYLTLTLFFIFDFGYYEYLSIRLDASSLRFLNNLKISTQVLFESYPVYKVSIGLLILGYLIFKSMKYIYMSFNFSHIKVNKKIKAFYFISTILLLSFGIYSSLTHYPLRWSQAYFSKNNTINQFTLNPVLHFFDSFKYRTESVNEDEFKKNYKTIAKHLNLPKDSISFSRKVNFATSFDKKPNVVIIMMESLGVKPIGYYGNTTKSTPVIDSLINNSMSFPNFYVHKYGTAASVFASVTGLPDIQNVRTASRNPLIQDQRILFDQFTGYEKLYFLGGSANWANIRSVFQSNIKGLKIFEEGSYETENRADVWGIDDYELFKESNKELEKLSKKDKPFVAYIQTSSNHMPFTVPDNKESYSPLKDGLISENLLNEGGFKSLAQLNALRYLDFNVGKFLERAKKSGYYDNTIFVFFGDHNTAMNKTNLLPKEYDLNIETLHVPFMIHGPKFIKPEINDTNGKIIDLFPTVINLAKIDHTNYTLGNNLLDSNYRDKAVSFLYLKIKGEPAVGIIKDSLYYYKTTISKTKGLYNLKEKALNDLKKDLPNQSKELDSLLNAYYHATKYLYFNNKKTN